MPIYPNRVCTFKYCNVVFTPRRSDRIYCTQGCASKENGRLNHISTKKSWRERFWAKVLQPKKIGACWLWQGLRDKNGYGVFGARKSWVHSYTESKAVSVHRISWFLHNGPIPKGAWVLHKCDNPPCLNPSHLFLGDAAANTLDMDNKGRRDGPRGERCKQSPLTAQDVTHIRELWAGGEWTQQSLGDCFGIQQSCISEIIHRKTWRHLP